MVRLFIVDNQLHRYSSFIYEIKFGFTLLGIKTKKLASI